MKNNGFITGYGINYAGSIPKIPKASDFLKPIYEAFTNSLESIKDAEKNKVLVAGEIVIDLILSEQELFSEQDGKLQFDRIVVEDSGIGFTDSEYKRFINLNDTGKGYSNRGTGRVQFLHFFDTTEITSIYKDKLSKSGSKIRTLIFSKQKAFLNQNAVVRMAVDEDVPTIANKTTFVFKKPLNSEDQRKYEEVNAKDLKLKLLEHYLGYFCENRSQLPKITIRSIHKKYKKNNGDPEMVPVVVQSESITQQDIPDAHESVEIEMYYQMFDYEEKRYKKSENKEILALKGFRVPKEKLSENIIKVTSKGQVTHTKMGLDSLASKDVIDDKRYLFLLSGKYFDKKDSDVRGKLRIPRKTDIRPMSKEQGEFFDANDAEWIFFEEIQAEANGRITQMYKEIRDKAEEKEKDIEDLKKMFLLKDESLNGVNVEIGDTDADVLEKIYRVEAKKRAKLDADLKHRIEGLKSLNTTDPDYQEKLEKEVNDLTSQIPLQNKEELSRYVARRGLVLELFEKIVNRQTDIQIEIDGDASARDKTESLLHNLIFRQKSTDPILSDLWLINEEFIYFQGTSEVSLGDVEINSKKLFKKEFSQIEKDYFEKGNGVKTKKRPDVLLFPEEGKCIILEFKTLDVDVSDHLTQIKKYSSWILNYSTDDLKITKFYGHLIGENVVPQDVIAADAYFESAAKFDYVYCPYTPVKNLDGITAGAIYMEAIKYSVLLERARLKNGIFIDRLGLNLERGCENTEQ